MKGPINLCLNNIIISPRQCCPGPVVLSQIRKLTRYSLPPPRERFRLGLELLVRHAVQTRTGRHSKWNARPRPPSLSPPSRTTRSPPVRQASHADSSASSLSSLGVLWTKTKLLNKSGYMLSKRYPQTRTLRSFQLATGTLTPRCPGT